MRTYLVTEVPCVFSATGKHEVSLLIDDIAGHVKLTSLTHGCTPQEGGLVTALAPDAPCCTHVTAAVRNLVAGRKSFASRESDNRAIGSLTAFALREIREEGLEVRRTRRSRVEEELGGRPTSRLAKDMAHILPPNMHLYVRDTPLFSRANCRISDEVVTRWPEMKVGIIGSAANSLHGTDSRSYYRVAGYRGRGVWNLDPHMLSRAIHESRDMANDIVCVKEEYGRMESAHCQVCEVRLKPQSRKAHLCTSKHYKKMREAFYRGVNCIDERLGRGRR